MTGVLSNCKRGILSLACGVGIFALTASASNAQSFNAYNTNQAILQSGFTFKIDGITQTNLSNVGMTGTHTYEFGFATPGVPIVLRFPTGSPVSGGFGIGAGLTDNMSAVRAFGLIRLGDIPGLGFGGNTIYNYVTPVHGVNSPAWGINNPNYGGFYDVGGFGAPFNLLRGGSEYVNLNSSDFGDFTFTNPNSAAGIFLALDIRDQNGVTSHVLVEGMDSPNLVPEGSSVAMLGCGALPLLGILIKRRRSRKA